MEANAERLIPEIVLNHKRHLEHMAKPNYAFEKRQREIAKKKEKDAKQSKKRAAREESRPDPATSPTSLRDS